MERNSDLIVMSCYAPLFVNVNPGGMQWESDLIGYDAMRSYGSPSYYAQVMFAGHIGDETLGSELEDGGPKLFYSVTRDTKNKHIYLKLVNASSAPHPLNLNFTGISLAKTAKVWTLSAGSTQATNTIDAPENIVPKESALRYVGTSTQYVAPGYSIQVLELDQR